MGRSVKAARQSLKDAQTSGEALGEMVKNDIKSLLKGFEDNLHARISAAEDCIIEASRAKEAVTAGVTNMRKDLEKAQRRFSKTNDKSDLQDVLLEIADDMKRLKVANQKIIASLTSVLNPPYSAVEVVERFAQDLQRSSGSWEAHARDLDSQLTDICDINPPAGLVELKEYMSDNGHDIIIAKDRSDAEINKAQKILGLIEDEDE